MTFQRAFMVVQAVAAILLAGWLLLRQPEPPEPEPSPSAEEPRPSGGLFGVKRPAAEGAEAPSAGPVVAGARLAPAPPPPPSHRHENVVVPAALDWLARDQEADGGWVNAGRTGLAVLAFLGSGVTHQHARRGSSVKRGLVFLEKDMDYRVREIDSNRPGCGRESYRDEALAGLALVEAYGMTGTRKLRASAEAAVYVALRSRSRGGGWDFFDSGKGPDVETTAFMVMLLKSAQASELGTYVAEIREAVAAIDRRTDPATGRIEPHKSREPSLTGDAATAMGMWVRVLAGRTPADDPVLAQTEAFLATRPPDSADFLHAYFGTLLAFRISHDSWNAWNRSMQTAVLDRQRAEPGSDDAGSWDPAGASASHWDRLPRTACLSLCADVRGCYPGRKLIQR